MRFDTVIFDLGNVLIDWNPRYVYRTIFNEEEKVEWFLENVCNMDWNERQDEGYPIAKAVEEKIAEYPEYEHEIRAYYDRWVEMLAGEIPESVDLFRRLKEKNQLKFYALTNWSAELFPEALKRFEFLHWFDGRVVSGEEKLRKPSPEFYRRLLDRYNVDPERTVFIDDNYRNIEAADKLKITTIHFTSPSQLENDLIALGFNI